MRNNFAARAVLCGALLAALIGCGPTYPKERFEESIVRICKDEYKLDVKVMTAGKTIAIYVPLTDLIDITLSITQAASEKINDVILSVSRVALSTDARYDFYCVIAHDIRVPEIQIVIIKSVDDVKRFMLNDISRSDYSKRMLIDIRMSPQSQKERAVKEIFDKMSLDRKWQDQVMDDFFRGEPTALSDIGYWNDRFYIKDVTMPEFLAEQASNRVKMLFRENKKLSELFFLKSVKNVYIDRSGRRFFKMDILVQEKGFKELPRSDAARKVFEAVLDVTAPMLRSYRFTDFDHIEVVNQADGSMISVSRDDLEEYRKKKATFEDIVQ
ncbi:MAG: hypothetical protein WC515_04815 [Candidatus Omnitrophota bacterium]